MEMRDVLGCVGSATFLLLASSWIPIAGPIIGLLTPLPFLYYSTKLGFSEGAKLVGMAVLAFGLLSIMAGRPHNLLLGTELGLLGLALSQLFRRGFSLGQTIVLGMLIMLFLGFVVLFFIALSRQMGPLEMILQYLQSHLKAALKAYEDMGMPPEKMAEFQAYGNRFVYTISKIYLSLMVVGVGFAVWLNVILARPLFRIGDLPYPHFVNLGRWQAPDGLVWGLIGSGFLILLTSGDIRWIAINAMIIIMAAYVFHGMSIVAFFLNKYHVSTWIRAGIYFLIFIQQVLLVVLALAGVFDQWIDFRKIRPKSAI